MNKKVLTLLSKLKEPRETVNPPSQNQETPAAHSIPDSDKVGRRSFLHKAGLGGLSLGSLFSMPRNMALVWLYIMQPPLSPSWLQYIVQRLHRILLPWNTILLARPGGTIW